MKHEEHKKRLSFRKWGMPGQRIETQDAEKLSRRRANAEMRNRPGIHNIGRNNGRLKSIPGMNHSTQFQLHKHNCVSDPMGGDAWAIPSYAYHPESKAPSRRDRRRELVREARG